MTGATTSNNPLLEEWTTPHGMPPFHAIRDEHFMPAFESAMRAHLAEVEEIAANPEPPTFANTIEALERSGRALEKIGATFYNLSHADTNEKRQAIEREMAPIVAKHRMAILTNAELFARIDALFQSAADLKLSSEQFQLSQNYHKNFVRSGAKLDDTGKARLTEIGARLSELNTQFGQNVLADEKAFQLILDKEDDLKGLPEFARQAAARAASERGRDGAYMISLSRASFEPFLEFSERRDLREIVYNAYVKRGAMGGESDNRATIAEILALRTEMAKLLGFPTYASFQIDNVMAKTPEEARRLLDNVWRQAKRKAAAEQTALQTIAQAEGHNEPLAAWDWHHYTEKRRKAEFEIDSATLKPYFKLDNMIAAAFEVARRLFGITFQERHDVPVYHPDVRVWEARESDGRVIGLFVGDYFHRSTKRSGAWMSSFRKQQRLDGETLPIIINVMNFSKGGDAEPSLLSLDDAETLFHEFGHGLHGLLSNVTYGSISGTSVDRDFVELPSQLFENWLVQPEILSRFALHADTGKPIPQDLIERVVASQKFNQGFATVEYTASAIFDLDVHEAAADGKLDVEAFERQMRSRIGVPDVIALRHRPTHFQHVFAGSGYAAGYYTYLWAEVMEADAFDAFKETGDVFNPEIAARLRDAVYSSGGKMKPDDAYRAFRGKEPSVEPLMEKRGLVEGAAA